MADIFVSYSSKDRDRAEAIATALAQHGWSVWWDGQIPIGKRFDEIINEQIKIARCCGAMVNRLNRLGLCEQ